MARHAAGLRVEVSVSGADAREVTPIHAPRRPPPSNLNSMPEALCPWPIGDAPWKGREEAAPATDTSYLLIFVTRPAPTVRPPSRMANRSWSSMAIGWISSTFICVVSPGMTISVPSGRVTTPVTSVVRK